MPLLAFSLSLSLSLFPSLSLTRTLRTFFKHTRFGEIMITCRRRTVTCFFVVLLTQSNRGTFLTVFGSSLVQKICAQYVLKNYLKNIYFIYFILGLLYYCVIVVFGTTCSISNPFLLLLLLTEVIFQKCSPPFDRL